MKKIALIFAALVVVAVILLAFTTRRGIDVGGLKLGNTDKQFLAEQTRNFLEDIQFKDFKSAASYSPAAARKRENIPHMIERLFLVKPEFLDIERYKILSVDIDSTGRRARVLTRTVVKMLNTKRVKEPEIMFYWSKDPKQGWVMHLQSSLR